jgi:tetratricopeptide (TPR) repeat protein
VVWIDARAWCADMDWGERALVSSSGLEEFCIAPRQPGGFPVGEPIRPPAPWRRLHQREFERETAAVRAALERLADGAGGSALEPLATGLARLAAAQVRSSPFETAAQQTELDVEGLRLLREAALASEPDLYLRELWSSLAWLLAEKREIEQIQEHLHPLAERWAPWWQLELALARADLESLDAQGAAEHLLRAVDQRPLDLVLRQACAEALSMAGRPAEAVEQLRAVEAMQPGRRDVRRLLAMELARAGDPAAEALLEELLREDPGDEELRAFQGPGPFPLPEVRFEPHSSEPHEHEGEGDG